VFGETGRAPAAGRLRGVGLLKVEPLLDELRAHPRFQALLRRMQFPEYEEITGIAGPGLGRTGLSPPGSPATPRPFR
jgi:hypothetical protein